MPQLLMRVPVLASDTAIATACPEEPVSMLSESSFCGHRRSPPQGGGPTEELALATIERAL
jgi:hypothetical protein